MSICIGILAFASVALNRTRMPSYPASSLIRQTSQEAFHGEVLQQFLERPALRAGLVQQSLSDGRAKIVAVHRIASRYGRIVLSTRSTFANLDSAR